MYIKKAAVGVLNKRYYYSRKFSSVQPYRISYGKRYQNFLRGFCQNNQELTVRISSKFHPIYIFITLNLHCNVWLFCPFYFFVITFLFFHRERTMWQTHCIRLINSINPCLLTKLYSVVLPFSRFLFTDTLAKNNMILHHILF